MTLKIDFKTITEDVTLFNYELDNAFFEAIDAPDIHEGKLNCEVEVRRTVGLYELAIHTEGTVQIQCDRCLDDMTQDVESDDRLVVKFGEEYFEDDDMIIVTEEESVVDLSWYVYEFIALAIPVHHAHNPEDCNAEMMRLLGEHRAGKQEGESEETAVDPRWSKLSELLKQ